MLVCRVEVLVEKSNELGEKIFGREIRWRKIKPCETQSHHLVDNEEPRGLN